MFFPAFNILLRFHGFQSADEAIRPRRKANRSFLILFDFPLAGPSKIKPQKNGIPQDRGNYAIFIVF